MDLDEKLAQLGGVWAGALLDGERFSESRAKPALAHGIGHVTRLAGSSVLAPRACAELANQIQRFLLENTRLGIPAIVHEESCAGFTARGATCFPQAIGLASTFEPALVRELADVIRRQMRAVGARHSLAPVLDVARDPRWGRTEETFGEDPYLVARMGVAYVQGLQGETLRDGVIATGKHFVGYGASEGGLNWAPAPLPRRELLERFVPPFAAAIHEAGLASVMNAYHEIDGVPCGASAELLEALLREELGFEGVVVSDYFTVKTLMTYHGIAANESEAAQRALEAGIDVELPALDCYGAPLREAVESGRVALERVDRAVARLLGSKFELGLFDDPYVDAASAPAIFDTPEQRSLARRVAAKSIVLLKNDGDLLPLDPALRSVAVIGPSADSARLLQGDYHYPTHLEIVFGPMRDGAPAPRPGGAEADAASGEPEPATREVDLSRVMVPTVTLLEGIRSAVSAQTEVHTARGCEILGDATDGFADAVATARAADVAIVAVGGKSGLVEGCTSGESVDRAALELPGAQAALVEAIAATGTPTVVVLVNGRPLALTRVAERVAALVEAWLPGEEGGHAVADVLFGRVDPAGRLPVSLPRAVGQVPLYYNHKPSGARSQWRGDYADLPTRPLFPFGHGLSYTRFDYANLSLAPRAVSPDGELEVALEVANVGERPGEEVVQLYVRDVVASLTRPVQELKGFARIALEPGECRRVAFRLDVGQLAFYDAAMQLVVEPGAVEIRVGRSSEDIRLSDRVEIRGPGSAARRRPAAPTRVELS
ncbi:MAG: glycoside hydrolase family 3 C-terminal domain-containing protein [Deltaproteobacteria bacterium]|nr:MAG: glycoside hydrolase family 3 C-terminal domain-containing protein [Deltaproteobacteria bacterium]